jgi:hypothetical protein
MTPNHGQETALKRVRTCDSPFGGAGWSVLFPTVSRLAERSRSLEFTVFASWSAKQWRCYARPTIRVNALNSGESCGGTCST